ncbi:MAG: hypothetical protein ACREC0_05405 [Methylocella sp.]
MSDAQSALDALLQSAAATPQLYPPNSRYYGQPALTITLPNGATLSYLSQRYVPGPEQFALLKLYSVVQGDRLDNLASSFFNDPQQYWRICDANNAIRPAALTETIGTQLRITLPQGVPGGPGSS